VTFDGERVHAVWNGATGVARWRLLAGPAEDDLRAVATVEWDGLDTVLTLPDGGHGGFVKVEALDAGGRPMGTSQALPIGR
jgi:hypothetical protein